MEEEPAESQHVHVVGIGASAGGIKALRTFFQAIPDDTGLAFVVVMHLSPEHESSLAELLQMVSGLSIQQVMDRVRMEPNAVYIIPPGKNIELTDGHLVLCELEGDRIRRAPIDHFFRTLAYGHPYGIGILLSGGGADGTVGMKAIKEQGGILMVQDPNEAEHGTMPRSAIATGQVDFVLPVKALAEKLIELKEDDTLDGLPVQQEALPETDRSALQKILARLHAVVGHEFSGYKESTILRRIERRMRVTQTTGLSAYLGYLQGHAREADELFKDLLISVTNFFRDADTWEVVEREVIPKLFENKAVGEDVRVWVPGCATGEEAYSVAILLLEYAASLEYAPRIQIFACDVDADAIATAREGVFPEAITADVSEERLKRFFIKNGSFYRVKEELREIVLFTTHNLLKDPPFSRLDFISCRNLLIYLERDMQEKVFEVFHYALRPEGHLLLGQSESASTGSNLFRPVDKKHRIYRWRRTPEGEKRLPALPLSAESWRLPAPRAERPAPAHREQEAARDLHRRGLEEFAPPSVLIDESRDILHLTDTAGRYLHHPGGRPTHHLVKAVREELRVELRAVLHEVFENKKAVATGPIETSIEGERRMVHVLARPAGDDHEGPLALVMFAEVEPCVDTLDVDGDGKNGSHIHQLEEELHRTRKRLQIATEEHETSEEELRAANEELQSINEEYKSTLEELETSKEELQSVNEELQTVNTELHSKIDELNRANNDLQNLMSSTEVASVFLDRDLKIKRFSPEISNLFNVMEVDRGRPLGHLTDHFVDYESVVEDTERVLKTLIPVEREVRVENDSLFLVRILPYRTVEDRIEGVVITFVDITRLHDTQMQIRQIEERHRLLLEQVQEYGIFTMNEDGHIASWNPGARRLFGYKEEEVLGKHGRIVFTPNDRDAGVPEEEMRTATREGQASDERWHVRKDGSRFWGSGVMTALHDDDGTLRGYAKVLRDNTQRREATQALEESQDRLKHLNQTLEEHVAERTAELERKSEQVRRLASDLIIAEQDERHRIAQILHDDLQQTLYGVQMRVLTLTRTMDSLDGDELKTRLKETQRYLSEAVEETRNLAIGLSPPVLEDEGLADAVRWLGSQMKELHKLHVDVEAEESFFTRSHEMRVLMFQILRELLFNVVKHAETNRASVALRRTDDDLCIEVEDAGKGFDSEPVLQDDGSRGFGLRSIRERLSLFDGTLDITSAPGEGTHVAIAVPVEPREQVNK